jgi:hypothetical protein
VTVADQLIAAGMAQHMRMRSEGQISLLTNLLDQVIEALDSEGSAALGLEYE